MEMDGFEHQKPTTFSLGSFNYNFNKQLSHQEKKRKYIEGQQTKAK
jgi:hypothetical protein